MVSSMQPDPFIKLVQSDINALKSQKAEPSKILVAVFQRFNQLSEVKPLNGQQKQYVISCMNMIAKEDPNLKKTANNMIRAVEKTKLVSTNILSPMPAPKNLVDEILVWLCSNKSNSESIAYTLSKDVEQWELRDEDGTHWRLTNGDKYLLKQIEKDGKIASKVYQLSDQQGLMISQVAAEKPLRETASLLGPFLGKTMVNFDAFASEPKTYYSKGEVALCLKKDGSATLGVVEDMIGKKVILLFDDSSLQRTDGKKRFDAKIAHSLNQIIPLKQDKVREWIDVQNDKILLDKGAHLEKHLGKPVSKKSAEELSVAEPPKPGDVVLVTKKGEKFLAILEANNSGICTTLERANQLVSKEDRMIQNRPFYLEEEVTKVDEKKLSEYLKEALAPAVDVPKSKLPPMPENLLKHRRLAKAAVAKKEDSIQISEAPKKEISPKEQEIPKAKAKKKVGFKEHNQVAKVDDDGRFFSEKNEKMKGM